MLNCTKSYLLRFLDLSLKSEYFWEVNPAFKYILFTTVQISLIIGRRRLFLVISSCIECNNQAISRQFSFPKPHKLGLWSLEQVRYH